MPKQYGIGTNDAPDRTNRQPPSWRCNVPECIREHGPENGTKSVQWTGDHDTCPRCGASGYPHVTLDALVHLLIPDPNGQIQGQHSRYRMGCHKGRDYLATMTNKEAASNDVRSVNCPECLEQARRLGITLYSPGGILLPAGESVPA